MYLYVDANVFMHYRHFTEIDWCALAEVDQVVLILCAITLKELDRHKDEHRLRKMRMRVSGVVKRIDEVLGDELEGRVRESVDLRFQVDATAADVEAHRLDPRSNDDVLLATVLEHRGREPDEDVAIVHHDRTLKLKARSRGIPTIPLGVEYRLEDALDEQDREIRELRRELGEIKARAPKLSLAFDVEDSPSLLRLTVAPPYPEPSAEAKAEELSAVRTRLDHFDRPSPAPTGLGLSAFAAFIPRITEEQREEFRQELDLYLEKYAAWIDKRPKVETVRRRFKKLGLELVNDGKVPAENVDLYVEIPEWLRVVTADELPEVPRGPVPPKRPEPQGLFGIGRLEYGPPLRPLLPYDPLRANLGPQNVSDAVVVTDDPRRARYVHMSVRELKHGHAVTLEPAIYVVFPSHGAVRGFEIRYEITAGNVHEKVTGALNVAAEVEEGAEIEDWGQEE